MKPQVKQAISLIVLMLSLVGCSTALAGNKTPQPTSTTLPQPQAVDPTATPGGNDVQAVITQAITDLQGRLGNSVEITVQEAIPTDFSDASLGVPEPGKMYAQVLTPGYVIRLAVGDQVYIYHGSGERVVLAAQETSKVIAVPGDQSAQSITIESVQVTPESIVARGHSTFPDGTSIQTELLANDQGATWWPESAYAVVENGMWQITVPLDGVILDRELEYAVHAWAEADESSKTVFQFDLAGPANQPVPPASGEAGYSRIEIANTGLSIDVPAGWLHLDPAWLWTPAEGSELYLGVNWIDLQPPQEAEPTLLPTPSQVLYSEEVMLSWGSGRRFLLEVYAPTTQSTDDKAPVQSVETHVLVIVNQEGVRRAFDLYAKGNRLEDMGTLEPLLQRAIETSALAGTGSPTPVSQGLALTKQDPATGWSTLQDSTYGYQVALPAGWTWKEMPTQGPGTPGDWPSTRFVLLYPQAWDAQINRSGPPDPTSKPVIAPLQIEVIVGPDEQFRRVYPEPTQSEKVEINGRPVVVEQEIYETMILTRYVFASPEDPDVHVTITDQMTGFPDRVVGNEAIVETIPLMIDAFEFIE